MVCRRFQYLGHRGLFGYSIFHLSSREASRSLHCFLFISQSRHISHPTTHCIHRASSGGGGIISFFAVYPQHVDYIELWQYWCSCMVTKKSLRLRDRFQITGRDWIFQTKAHFKNIPAPYTGTAQHLCWFTFPWDGALVAGPARKPDQCEPLELMQTIKLSFGILDDEPLIRSWL